MKMNQKQTPLYDALLQYTDRQIYSLHVPGHKDGLTFFHRAQPRFQSLLQIDATEIEGLDDYYHATGVIAEAQALLTDLYGTVKSYFLVNGTTVGNLAMVKAALRPGDRVLVQRDSHKSIFNALKLMDLRPVFLASEIDPDTGLAPGPSKETVAAAIRRYPDAKALILTYPNYYGMANKDMAEIIKLAKQKGLIVLVDEAHGAHFIAGKPFPESTLKMGADLVVQSAHKTLPAMTMGSYLHINTERVLPEAVEAALEMLQTSSPSYPIMASLDLARAYLAAMDDEAVSAIADRIAAFKEQLSDIPGIEIASSRLHGQDPLKVVLRGPEPGFSLQERLIKAGLYPEMADPFYVLFLLPLDDRAPFERILQAMRQAFAGMSGVKTAAFKANGLSLRSDAPIGELAVGFREMDVLDKETVPLSAALDRVAAETIIPYPPGVPVLLNGERVTAQHLEAIARWRTAGAKFHGLDAEAAEATLTVYKL